MEIEIIDKFKFLPDEIINHIFSYTNAIVYRYGKYMNKLRKNDERYKIVMGIPVPMKIGLDRFLLRLVDKNQSNKPGYFIEYIIGDNTKVNIKCISFEKDGFDIYLKVNSYSQYIFDANSKWSQLIHYSM
jgi:hypothetical protein